VNDTLVTVVGNVVDSPRRVSLTSGTVTNFRLASTARRYDSSTQQFVDSGTFWVDVECWNALSGNVSASVSKGDPVIVHGALTTHSWESENGSRSKPRIKAFAVGPNLSKGRALFTRDKTGRAEEATTAGESAAPHDTPEQDQFPSSIEELRSGRDYDVDAETLEQMNADLSPEPAHA